MLIGRCSSFPSVPIRGDAPDPELPRPVRAAVADEMPALPPVDERWADFAVRFGPLTERYPLLLAARHELFWSSMFGWPQVGPLEPVKEVARGVLRRSQTSLPPGGCDVAFLVDSPRDILADMVLPVIERLEAQGRRAALLLTPGAATGSTWADRQATVIRWPFRLGDARERRRIFKEVRNSVPESVGPKDWPNFSRLLRMIGSLDREVMRILERLRPRVVVQVRDQTLFPTAFSTAARRLGIKTLALQHGLLGSTDVPLIADSYAVWGPSTRDQLVRAGADPDRIAVLGSPRHDSVGIADPSTGKAVRKAMGVEGKLVLTFFSGTHAERLSGRAAQVGCARWLDGAGTTLGGDVAIFVRLHPDEDDRVYRGLDGLRVLPRSLDVATVFAASDVVGSLCSTALQESVLHGKPPLQFLADDWPEMTDLWRDGLAHRVGSEAESVGHLRRLCDRAAYEATVRSVGRQPRPVFRQRRSRRRCRDRAHLSPDRHRGLSARRALGGALTVLEPDVEPPGSMQGCRLLYLTPQLESGGLERQLTYLLSAMDRGLYRPCVAVWNYDEAQPYVAALRKLSVPLVPMPPGSPAWVKVRSLRALTRRLRPEIAHSYSYYTNAAVAYACWKTSTIAVGSIRCDYEYERASGHVLGRLSGRWPRRQICNSWTALANVSRRRLDPFTPRTLEVVQNAVDLERFHPCSPPVNGPTTIVGVGALSQRKNWGVLLPALAEWRRDGLDFAFRIAGEASPRRSRSSGSEARARRACRTGRPR